MSEPLSQEDLGLALGSGTDPLERRDAIRRLIAAAWLRGFDAAIDALEQVTEGTPTPDLAAGDHFAYPTEENL